MRIGKFDKKRLEAEEKRQDLGFGNTLANIRLINANGSFNVNRLGKSLVGHLNIYHRLITMSWAKFFGIILVGYFLANIFFASLYTLTGLENLNGASMVSMRLGFLDAFFFSAQTITTVGYGHISPKGTMASSIAALESLIGLLTFALGTGLLYARFSRPVAKVLFSNNALISPYLGIQAFMFRIANERDNQLTDAEIVMSLSRMENDEYGTPQRKYFLLKLERSHVSFFPLSWTLVHAITEDSPLFGSSAAEMKASQSEFLVMFKATDNTYSQAVHLQKSYIADEIVWNAKFRKAYEPDPESNMVLLHLNQLSAYDLVDIQ